MPNIEKINEKSRWCNRPGISGGIMEIDVRQVDNDTVKVEIISDNVILNLGFFDKPKAAKLAYVFEEAANALSGEE